MAKKVLIISSSPRKGGNSDLLCDEMCIRDRFIAQMPQATNLISHAILD